MSQNEIREYEIFCLLKDIIPKCWKYSLRASDYCVELTIREADIDLLDVIGAKKYTYKNLHLSAGTIFKNHVCKNSVIENPEKENIISLFDTINKALHNKNYFDYVVLSIGNRDKPFVFLNRGEIK